MVLAIVSLLAFAARSPDAEGGFSLGGDAVAIIEVRGAIQGGEGGGFSGGAFSDRIVRHVRRAQQDPSVKAIVLRVDSPGGAVTASDEIYREILRTRQEHHKVVVASFGELAASGGYYVSAAADKIVTSPTTITGSIGVISAIPDFQELLEKVGVKIQVIKSGAHKDETSGFRSMTEEERAIWQDMTNEMYDRFVEVVAQGRNMEPANVRKLADGRVYSGRQAVANGLADQLGDLQDAIQLAGEMSGIKGKPRMVRYAEPGFLDLFSGSLGTLLRQRYPWSDIWPLERPATLYYRYVGPQE